MRILGEKSINALGNFIGNTTALYHRNMGPTPEKLFRRLSSLSHRQDSYSVALVFVLFVTTHTEPALLEVS
jgi:hypothetical protein